MHHYYLPDCLLVMYRCTHPLLPPPPCHPPGKEGYASLFPRCDKCQNPPMHPDFLPDCLLIVYRCTRPPPPPPCHPPGTGRYASKHIARRRRCRAEPGVSAKGASNHNRYSALGTLKLSPPPPRRSSVPPSCSRRGPFPCPVAGACAQQVMAWPHQAFPSGSIYGESTVY
jgi:hypothetical protein